MSKNFEELLKALKDQETEADATLAKAQPQAGSDLEDEPDDDPAAGGEGGAGGDGGDGGDDAAIQAAAAEAGAGDEGDDKGSEFGKSFEFTDEHGQKQKAVDATDLVKSLIERLDTTDDTLAKALTAMTGVVSKQGELIKSLTAKVEALGGQGRGRKTMLTVVEKPDAGTLAKAQGADKGGMEVGEFFAKANAAFDAGKITGRELTTIDVCRRSNVAPDPALIQKVLSA